MTPDELRALADSSTPGPWEIERDSDIDDDGNLFDWPMGIEGVCEFLDTDRAEADARLIALAPSLARDHAALLDWAARAAHFIAFTDGSLDPTALLAEWAEMQERPS